MKWLIGKLFRAEHFVTRVNFFQLSEERQS